MSITWLSRRDRAAVVGSDFGIIVAVMGIA
jgi:hypothetical protein